MLQGPLFGIHVSSLLFAYASFALACVIGITYVLLFKEIKAKHLGFFYARLPSLQVLDRMNQRAIVIGWIFLTVGIIVGGVWAAQARGGYSAGDPRVQAMSLQDPKIFVALLCWLVYSFELFAARRIGWGGRRAAYLSALGFADRAASTSCRSATSSRRATTFYDDLEDREDRGRRGSWQCARGSSICSDEQRSRGASSDCLRSSDTRHYRCICSWSESVIAPRRSSCASGSISRRAASPARCARWPSADRRARRWWCRPATAPSCTSPATRRRRRARTWCASSATSTASPASEVAPHVYEVVDLDVARHLFRVAAGLDSLVVGEPQILGQVKDAHTVASDAHTAGPVLNRLFHSSFAVGKRVRTETGLGVGRRVGQLRGGGARAQDLRRPQRPERRRHRRRRNGQADRAAHEVAGACSTSRSSAARWRTRRGRPKRSAARAPRRGRSWTRCSARATSSSPRPARPRRSSPRRTSKR